MSTEASSHGPFAQRWFLVPLRTDPKALRQNDLKYVLKAAVCEDLGKKRKGNTQSQAQLDNLKRRWSAPTADGGAHTGPVRSLMLIVRVVLEDSGDLDAAHASTEAASLAEGSGTRTGPELR